MDLGISVCYRVLEQTGGQDVVSLGPGESCGLCVSPAEKQLGAGEPTEEMFYLKELHSRSCPPPVARGQGVRAGPPRHPGHVDTELGGSTKRLKPSGEVCREEEDGWIQNVQCAQQAGARSFARTLENCRW